MIPEVFDHCKLFGTYKFDPPKVTYGCFIVYYGEGNVFLHKTPTEELVTINLNERISYAREEN